MKTTGRKTNLFIMLIAILSTLSLGCFSSYAKADSAASADELKNKLIEYFSNKTEMFAVDYTETSSLSGKDFSARLMGIIDQSQKETPDFVHYNIKKIASRMTGKVGQLSISFDVEYWSTKEQDEYVDKRIDEILGEIIAPDMNIYQKERAVYDYITSNVSYSASLKELSHTAYSALKNNQAVCQGFAVLLNKMLEKAGIENRIISGVVNGREFHLWNIANLEGKWYQLDATWDAFQPGAKEHGGNRFFNVTADYMKDNGHQWEENDYPLACTIYDESLSDGAASSAIYEKAVESVLAVEISKSHEDYAEAAEIISSLPYSSDKVRLQKALDSIRELIATRN